MRLHPLAVHQDHLDPTAAIHRLANGMDLLAGVLSGPIGAASGEIRMEDPTEVHGFTGAHRHPPD